MNPLGVLLIATAVHAAPRPPGFLLPNETTPRKHIIELTIDPARESFEGFARIEVDLLMPSAVVWLNGKDLTIREASIEFGGKALKARATAVGGEFLSLEPEQPVGPGRAVLSIRYQAPLSDKAVAGPFRKKVEQEWYAFTVFTPIDARRAFPCFDEPRFKTPWEMSIRVKREHKAFANAPRIAETDEPNGMKLVRFATTQPLPAEIVAFAAGPFDVWDGGKAGQKQTPVRVITAKGQASQGKEAALATQQILPKLERYTGIPYPWDKLDHIALPQGAFGATENPGLITYVSRGLLIPAGEATEERLRRIRSLQAHEIGHQWFGNLVTQASWEDVWLSEGFATWFSARIMDEEQPASRRRLNLLTSRERIMASDAGPKSVIVRSPMKSRDDMTRSDNSLGVYNQFAYQKGGAVLLMLERWLGDEPFQKGIQAYLKAHQMGNATTADLAAALREASGADPAGVMNSFLNQTGIPHVSVETRCDSGKPPRIMLEQTETKGKWVIPVCLKTSEAATCTILDGARGELSLPGGACPSWVYPNAGGAGYFRTDWTAAQVAALAESGLGALTAAERLTLFYDLRAQEKAGRLTAEAIKPILSRLESDAEPEIARAAKEAAERK